MNSKVRQAQKEGAAIEDISAGLVYSVVRNALYKVLKIRKRLMTSANIVVQGGTFKNNALLRAFEKITGRNVLRIGNIGVYGAYGAALVSKDREGSEKSSLISKELLISFDSKSGYKALFRLWE